MCPSQSAPSCRVIRAPTNTLFLGLTRGCRKRSHAAALFALTYARPEWRSAGTGLRSYRVRGFDGSCAKHLTIEYYTVVMLLTFIRIDIYIAHSQLKAPNASLNSHDLTSIPSPPHSFIQGLKPYFSANPSHRSLSFLLLDRLHGLPGLFTDTYGHIRFLLVSFFLFSTVWLLVPGGRLS